MVNAVKQIILVCGFAAPKCPVVAVASATAEAMMAMMAKLEAMSDAELLALLVEPAAD